MGKALEKCENDIRDMLILALPQKMREFVISHKPQTLSDVKKYMELSKALQVPKVNVLEKNQIRGALYKSIPERDRQSQCCWGQHVGQTPYSC